MGKFSLLNHFHHFWQAYLQMVNRHIKIKKPATSAYKKNDKNMYKNCSNSRLWGVQVGLSTISI
jgi:hypothetical protein